MTEPRDVWFHYTATPARFSAWPVNAKGWAALIALIAGPQLVLLPILVSRGVPRGWFTIVLILAVILAAIGGAVLLVRARGRRV